MFWLSGLVSHSHLSSIPISSKLESVLTYKIVALCLCSFPHFTVFQGNCYALNVPPQFIYNHASLNDGYMFWEIRFHHCVKITGCTYTNLDGIGYYTCRYSLLLHNYKLVPYITLLNIVGSCNTTVNICVFKHVQTYKRYSTHGIKDKIRYACVEYLP